MWVIKKKGNVINRFSTRKKCVEWVYESLLILVVPAKDIEIIKEVNRDDHTK